MSSSGNQGLFAGGPNPINSLATAQAPNSAQFQQFMQTQDAQALNIDPSIAKEILAGNVYSGGGDGSNFSTSPVPGQGTGIANIMQSFNSWQNGQNTLNQSYNSYLQLADNQMGRDQTILTGPATQRTALG